MYDRNTHGSAWGVPAATAHQAASLDAGLRSYMLGVYNWMASGLALTGIVAFLVATVPAVQSLFWTIGPKGAPTPTLLGFIGMLAPLAFVLVLSFGVNRLSRQTAQALYWTFAAVMGVSLSSALMVYTGASVASTFFVTAGMYAGVSLFGYTTQRNLQGMGTFLMMGLIGMMLAGLVNIFLGSSLLSFVYSVVGVVVFTGFTAYDTQRIKLEYLDGAHQQGVEAMAKNIVYDALSMYLNFINLFQLMLNFMGVRVGGDD